MANREEVYHIIEENPGITRRELTDKLGQGTGKKISKLLLHGEVEEEETPWSLHDRGLWVKGAMPKKLVEFPRNCQAKKEAGYASSTVSLAACINCQHLEVPEITDVIVVFGCDLDPHTLDVNLDHIPDDLVDRLKELR